MTDEDVGRFAVHRFDFPGVDIKSRQMRWYPNGALAVHALGYVSALSETDLQHVDAGAYAGTSVIGKLGVEAAYEKQLHGTNGFRQIQVNAEGRSVESIGSANPHLRTQAPIAGETLILGLDLKVQQAAEDALGTHRGAVVALDPRNGDVIALVSKPGFDPTELPAASPAASTRRWRTIRTVRCQPRAAWHLSFGLDHQAGDWPGGPDRHSITPTSKCSATHFRAAAQRAHLSCRQGGPRGMLDLTVAIAKSSDVYFYKLAHEMGIDKLDEGLARLRLRPADRHRHQRREARPAALARVEEDRLQAPRRPGLVSR